MQRIAAAIFFSAVIIGVIGERWTQSWAYVFGDVSPLWRDVVIWLQWFDRQMIELGMFPTLIAVGILGLILTYEGPRLWAHFRRHQVNAEAFYKAFKDTALSRSFVRDYMSDLYANVRAENWDAKFADYVRRAGIPASLPFGPKGNLLAWSQSSSFYELDEVNFDLYCFVARAYPPEKVKCINEILDTNRQQATKFWDEWGLRVRRGDLRLSAIQEAVRSSAVELTLLTYLEVAQARQAKWDDGPGKSGLFYIANCAHRLVGNGAR